MKRISELNKGDKVLVYNIDENTYFFSTIKDIDVKSSKIFFEGYSIYYNRQIRVFEEKEEISKISS